MPNKIEEDGKIKYSREEIFKRFYKQKKQDIIKYIDDNEGNKIAYIETKYTNKFQVFEAIEDAKLFKSGVVVEYKSDEKDDYMTVIKLENIQHEEIRNLVGKNVKLSVELNENKEKSLEYLTQAVEPKSGFKERINEMRREFGPIVNKTYRFRP